MKNESGFRQAVDDHYAYPPETWAVVRKDTRLFTIARPDGAILERFTRKRDADTALSNGGGIYGRIWRETDQWYDETTRDPRLRPLTDDERAIIGEAKAARAAAPSQPN